MFEDIRHRDDGSDLEVHIYELRDSRARLSCHHIQKEDDDPKYLKTQYDDFFILEKDLEYYFYVIQRVSHSQKRKYSIDEGLESS
jgi:hypothetical protein